jgi:hypothetical protein
MPRQNLIETQEQTQINSFQAHKRALLQLIIYLIKYIIAIDSDHNLTILLFFIHFRLRPGYHHI